MLNKPFLILGLANKCVDINHGNLDNLTDIILNATHGENRQLWFFTEDGFIISSLNSHKCLGYWYRSHDVTRRIIL